MQSKTIIAPGKCSDSENLLCTNVNYCINIFFFQNKTFFVPIPCLSSTLITLYSFLCGVNTKPIGG